MAYANADVDRFEAVILPHLDAAYTLARYLLRDEHDAQDAVQDAALRAFRHFDGYRGGDPRAWLLAIVRNCCRRSQRRRAGRRWVSFSDLDAPPIHAAQETDAAAVEASNRAAVERLVAALPVEFREVLVLRELQGLSYAQISAVVGVPVGTVMSRLSRARKRIAATFGGQANEAS